MNSFVSILEVSTNLNECLIAARNCWTQFSSPPTPSQQEIDLLQDIYTAALNCGEHISEKITSIEQKEELTELIILLLNIIHSSEASSIPFPLSPKHFPVLSQLITQASNESLTQHFLKPLLDYLENNYLRSLSLNRLLTISIQAAKNNNLTIFETLCELNIMTNLSITQLYDLREALLSLIPHAMLYVSPPSPVVQLVTKVDKYLKSLEFAE